MFMLIFKGSKHFRQVILTLVLIKPRMKSISIHLFAYILLKATRVVLWVATVHPRFKFLLPYKLCMRPHKV